MSDKPSVEKLVEPLKNKDGYFIWKRKMKAFLRIGDIDLVALNPKPDKVKGQPAQSQRAISNWRGTSI